MKIHYGLGIVALISVVVISASYINAPKTEVEAPKLTTSRQSFLPHPEPPYITIYPDRLVTNNINPGRRMEMGIEEVNGRKPSYLVAWNGTDPYIVPQAKFVDRGNGKTNVVLQLSPNIGLKSARLACLYRDQ